VNKYTECPNCVFDRIIVQLEKKGSTMRCPKCNWPFEMKNSLLKKLDLDELKV